MMRQIFGFAFIISAVLFNHGAHSLASIYKLNELLSLEKALVEKIGEYQGKVPNDLTQVFEVISNASAVSRNNIGYLDNPLNSFHLLKRFSSQWMFVIKYCSRFSLLGNDCEDDLQLKDLVRELTKMTEGFQHLDQPIYDYLAEAAIGIARLTTFYGLELDQLVEGRILNKQGFPLNVEDVEFISKQCERSELYYEHAIFQEKLLKMLKKQYLTDSTAHRDTIDRVLPAASILAHIYYNFKLPWMATDVLQEFTPYGNEELLTRYRMYNISATEVPDYNRIYSLDYWRPIDPFSRHCNQDLKETAVISKLTCRHYPTSIPYYRIKEEIIHRSPRISRFHDVISEQEISLLKSYAYKGMERSRVKSDGDPHFSATRISETKWIDIDQEIQSSELKRLAWRVSLVSGLDAQLSTEISSAEQFQVVNYGVGGLFHPHYDSMNNPLWNMTSLGESHHLKGTGDRLATWMFYLSDVEAGGATVFTELDTKVNPIKGSAVFWYNYRPNGDIDLRTLHGGCPVLLGSKWVTNRWIRQSGQVLSSLCGKSSNTEEFVSRDI